MEQAEGLTTVCGTKQDPRVVTALGDDIGEVFYFS